jgi:transposase-like protein
MEHKPRRKFSADFKAKVVIEVLKERSTVEELSRKYEIHPTQISTWKKEFLSKVALVFESEQKPGEDKEQKEAAMEKLYAQIGQLKVENDWLKKKLQ